MKRHIIIFLLAIAVTPLFSQESRDQVSGFVTDAEKQAIPHVNIIIKKTDRGTQTDADGKYAILAKAGDTLVFSHIGKLPVEVRVKRYNFLNSNNSKLIAYTYETKR